MRSLAALFSVVLLVGCGAGTFGDPPVDMPEIVARAIAFHGGDVYEHAAIAMTITSRSGSFQIETTRDGGTFEQVVTGRSRDVERRVRLSNDAVQEWHDGVEITLDAEGTRRARAFVDARVFFPLLPFTLDGGDIRFEDLGTEDWKDRTLHKVKVMFEAGTSNDADDNYMFWFDPETGRVEQFGYDFDGGLRFRQAVAFTRVGGVLFSDQDNYAIDGGRIPVDTLTPTFVDENMALISSVVITDIDVEPI